MFRLRSQTRSFFKDNIPRIARRRTDGYKLERIDDTVLNLKLIVHPFVSIHVSAPKVR